MIRDSMHCKLFAGSQREVPYATIEHQVYFGDIYNDACCRPTRVILFICAKSVLLFSEIQYVALVRIVCVLFCLV